ncbi:hypothetical protein BH20ACI1_BH20ACI1_27600 [soil metagenome]
MFISKKFLTKKYCRAVIFFGLYFAIFAPLSNFAATLAQYRENVSYAKVLTIELLYPDAENMSAAEYLEFERGNLSEIRKALPKNEKIEWRETSIETGNQWLSDKLDNLENEAENSSKRERILTEIYERLDAIELKLEELENPSAQTRTKDEDKQKLAEILRREEFQKPEAKIESLFQKIVRKIKQWFAEFFPRPNLPEGSANGFQSLSFILQIFLYATVLGAIGFLIYRFAPFLTNRFRQREKEEKKDRVILGERLSENETAQNLFNQAEQLAREGNLRGAIRKGYIALLCELSDRKIIGLAQHKTNRDYLRDVRQKRELDENMNNLTNNFERHWYGFEAAETSDWEEFRQKYNKAINIS